MSKKTEIFFFCFECGKDLDDNLDCNCPELNLYKTGVLIENPKFNYDPYYPANILAITASGNRAVHFINRKTRLYSLEN